ncbi:uncharacterized protein LOC129602601 [Paramacrobiotus metropolitanus]|uniref:uncharacterized protein LOC129602601 n=1 Tax=Paramacrobiotus metropolitanus TaxID=2943436 RepID=UPI0024458A27|nr:uncharacterized protein LOC129602601 [Paramacrobiotus metropolitanus]
MTFSDDWVMGDGRKMLSSKPRGMYNRFRIAEDLALCEEVINARPFSAPNKNAAWTEIVDNLNAIPLFSKPTDERACKQRVEDLLMQFRTNDVAKLKRSRTEEQYEQLKSLLAEIASDKEISENSPSSPSSRPSLPKSTGKRSFPISMAEPEVFPQRRHAYLNQQIQESTKPVVNIAPKPAPTVVKVVRGDPPTVHVPTGTGSIPIETRVVKAGVVNAPDADQLMTLTQQNARQLELRERELTQNREIREKELELERERLHFEERKWQQHLDQFQQQFDLMREMLQLQQEQQQLFFSFFRQQEYGKGENSGGESSS